MNWAKYNFYTILCLIVSFLFACSNDETYQTKTEIVSHKVAVIMPASEQQRWERVANWALSNADVAQNNLKRKIKLELVWIDENNPDWESLAKNVSYDDSYVAIIGPKSSINAHKVAQFCKEKKKTLILPIATSTELQRIYSGSDYVWNLSQSDITQCELLLSQAKLSERKYVSLLTSNDDYGKSFSDWFGFQALELGLTVEDVIVYNSESEIREAVQQQYNKNRKFDRTLLFAPGKEKDALVLDDELCKLKSGTKGYFEFPLLLCSDAMNSSLLLQQLKYSQYEGLALSATPNSGFNSLYKTKFGEEPICGEAHLFDAITLLHFALAHKKNNNIEDLDNSILAMINGRTTWNVSWLADDMRSTFEMINKGVDIDLSGVTGDWTFDERTHASILNSTYNHWLIQDGKYTTLEYLSKDGGSNTISTTQAWEWKSSNMIDFNPEQANIEYPELEEKCAVVIGTSDKWAYYRHQADALAMYQLLKRHGYDDDHIILIIEDNIAYHPNNIYPGVVKVRPDGDNLYHDVVVDYKINDITPSDLQNILTGNKSTNLKDVVSSTSSDNIIIFWCGHGSPNRLAWGGENTVYSWQIHDILQEMYNSNKYRKILFSMEACYSGSIAEACKEIPGVLFITAANAYETSKADMKDADMGIWLSNGFTRAFQESIDENPHITMRDLYYKLARQTIGSHATVYNHTYYGNMYTNTMKEYLN